MPASVVCLPRFTLINFHVTLALNLNSYRPYLVAFNVQRHGGLITANFSAGLLLI